MASAIHIQGQLSSRHFIIAFKPTTNVHLTSNSVGCVESRHNLSDTQPSDQLLIRVTCQIYFVLTSIHTRQGCRITSRFSFKDLRLRNAQPVEVLKALNYFLRCRGSITALHHRVSLLSACTVSLMVCWTSSASPA